MMPEIRSDLGVSVDYILEKFDGEKVPGDGKEPVEIIQGGDGKPTFLLRENGIDLDPPRMIKEADETETQYNKKE